MSEMVFSYSRLDSFQGKYGCPWKWYLRYVLELPEPTTPALLMGKAAHSIIEMLAGPAKGIHPAPLVKAVAKTNDLDETELLNLVYHPVVNQIIFEAAYPMVEEHFVLNLKDITLQGYIDLHSVQGNHILLVDWKTNQQSYRVLDTHQLGLYAAYLKEKYQLPVVGKLVFLRTGWVESHQFTDEDIQEAVDWANRLGSDILERLELLDSMSPESLFPKCPGTACQYCGFAGRCNSDETEIPDSITTQEEARKVAEKIVLLEAQSDQLKGLLKPWVEKMGPVPVNGTKEFRIDESYWWKFPNGSLQKAVELMREQGYDPLKILRLTAEGLKQLSWDDATLQSLGAQKQISKRFVFATKK